MRGIDRIFEIDRAHAERPAHLHLHLAHPACPEFPVLVEVRVVLDGLSFLKRPYDRILFPAHGKVEPDLALVLRGRESRDDVVGRDPGRLHAVQRKEDRRDKARLPGPVIPEDAGDAVRELDLLVPKPFEVLEDEPVE